MFNLKFSNRLIILLIIILSLNTGCMKNTIPEHHKGGLRLYISAAEKSGSITTQALASDIVELLITLTHCDKKLHEAQRFPYTGVCQEATFSSLYPGEWKVEINGLDHHGDIIFYGSQKINVELDTTKEVNIMVNPAPGFVEVSFDASGIIAQGIDVSKGTFYIYLNSENNSSTSYTMMREGNFLKVRCSAPEGNFQAKLAVPNVSSPDYVSPYYTLKIIAGKTTVLCISPNGTIIGTGTIDSTPATPSSFTATYQSHSSNVVLHWLGVIDSDLAGYRIYRTNSTGRFERIGTVEKTVTTFTNSVTSSNFYDGKIGYAVSSYDQGGNESFWSEAVYVIK